MPVVVDSIRILEWQQGAPTDVPTGVSLKCESCSGPVRAVQAVAATISNRAGPAFPRAVTLCPGCFSSVEGVRPRASV